MKCPKCGYNSFEYNDICTKCSNDLASYKEKIGIQAIVLPLHARQSMAEILKTTSQSAGEEAVTADSSSDVFSFDLPDSKQNPVGLNKDPFDFNDEDFGAKPEVPFSSNLFDSPVKSLTDNQDFNSLLESTPKHQSAPAVPSETQPKNGEFDLSDFSWEEPPATTPSGEPAKVTDDFSSLFGDSKGASK